MAGDARASGELLDRHRHRLKRMITNRLDPRLRSRVDPSDIVQETLTQASIHLSSFRDERTDAFYPWLRRIALNTITDHFRRHVLAEGRSVLRENAPDLQSPSLDHLAISLATSAASPSKVLNDKETRRKVRAALDVLEEQAREVLILKYLEEMPSSEIAMVLEVDESTVRRRHRLALKSLSELLGDNESSRDRR